MASHQRTMPLLRLLVRLRWQRDRNLWTVRCGDEHGRQARMFVHLSPTGISITVSSPGTVQLTPWQVGQLRLALRDAVLHFGELAGPQEPGGWGRAAAPDPAPSPPADPPVRESVRFRPPPARPTVAQIAQRLADSAAAERTITMTMPTARYPVPERLLLDVVADGFVLYCCGRKADPNALVASYEWENCVDLVTIRGFDRVTTARVPKRGKVDVFAPEVVVWAYEGSAQWALPAVLNLVHPQHPDAPTTEYPAPPCLHITRAEQRPLTIKPPSQGRAGVRAARLAAAMAADESAPDAHSGESGAVRR